MSLVSKEYLETKKMIAKSAINVSSKRGYSNVSMKNIMKEANVSKGGLYAYFENIDSVFIATLMYDDFLRIKQLLIPNSEKQLCPQINNWIYQIILSVQNEKVNLARAKSEFFLSHDMKDVPYLYEGHERLF